MVQLRRFVWATVVLAIVVSQSAAAQAGPAVTRDLGRMHGDAPVRIGILMRYRHESELAALTLLQGDRRSRYYHRYLSNAQWNAYFAADAQTYARTIALLRRRGFSIDRTYANRSMIRAIGPAALVERYFRTELHAVAQDGYGTRYRNAIPFAVPDELRSVAAAGAGLDATVHVTEPHTMSLAARATRRHVAAASPGAVSTSTPGPNPSPDPTLSPAFSPEEDYTTNTGYGPAIWATAYDFPVQHGYGGSGEALGSIINEDFANSDVASEIKLYDIPRTGGQYRVYTDGSFASTDTAGESTLDAEILETLAPAADYYEYLTQYFDSLGIEGAYAQVVSDNVVAAVNSSFGGCETNDPSFEYATNYLAMQGAAKGITFGASAGDTGALACGAYVMNGISGSNLGVQVPCADVYFVCAGGTAFQPITSENTYTSEVAWISGGGGVSVLEPLPAWQAQTANVIATGRNVPDLAFTADSDPPGVGFVFVFEGAIIDDGGTSVASPMFVALQTEIDQVQKSRNGFVNPRIYDVGNAAESFAFRDISVGNNGTYFARTGYDNTTGFGSPRGFELAGAE